ncbi:hypothetical protein G3M58_64795 [Streptomyces sp. SID7499]|uniref:ABC transporter ATP-binding protein n=1 Tax=Streptomyces sp. SID7499 TaxID=2706086 RepID=A0A6G3XIH6_9ACTN|nr:hypothetical protein [Streptomyces sp. SID7499]
MPTAPAIEVAELRGGYAGRPAFDGGSFAVAEGRSSGSRPERWGILG